MGQTKLEKSKKILESKKQMLFQRLQRAYDRSKDIDSEIKIKDFKIRCLGLDETKVQFEKLIEEWNDVNLDLNADFIPDYQELNAFCEMYYAVKLVAESVDGVLSEKESVQSGKMEGQPRLPKIDLLDFDGDPLKWPLFYETFKTLIHENPNLDLVSKIHYLVGKLKGKALSVCAGVVPSAENYFVLWDALVEKYEDKRTLASIYLSQVMNFKPITQDSVENLINFIDKVDASIKSLYQLRIHDLGDFILTSICLSKLDTPSRLLFERSLVKSEFPTYAQLSEFVKDQIKILGRTTGNSCNKLVSSRQNKPAIIHSFAVNKRENISGHREKFCELCNSKTHSLHKCFKFLGWSQIDRKKFVFQKSLCFNCLKAGHQIAACSSSFHCSVCKGKHHSLLHTDKAEFTKVVGPTTDSSEEKGNMQVSLVSTDGDSRGKINYTIVLATAVILVRSSSGEFVRMRVLIDSASQCNFVTKRFCLKLGIPIRSISASVAGIGASVRSLSGQVVLKFSSRFQPTWYEMKALVIDKITDSLPSCYIADDVQQRLKTLDLADDTWATPGPIDGMLGAELVAKFLGVSRGMGPGLPQVIDSPLGVIVMGRTKTQSTDEVLQTYCCTQSSEINQLMEKFWALESLDVPKTVAPEDSLCEKLFATSLQREKGGRYVVTLPFERFPPCVGDSYNVALKRFLSLEKKFTLSPEFKGLYSAVIQDYLDQGHMRLVDADNLEFPHYYIPHHGVWKPSSTSTPLRVVFDASAKSTNGLSLNDNLYSGPKLQGDIFELLLQFRCFAVALTADVKQMYRQIKVHSDHQPFQRVLWRFDTKDPVRSYELTTVTFGVKSSPFLALRTVQQLVKDEADMFPKIAARIGHELYMDDLISSVPDLKTGMELFEQAVGLFRAGGFELVKWASNSLELNNFIPGTIRRDDDVQFATECLKVLGLQWRPETDKLFFRVDLKSLAYTKREILSTMARIWDPLGLLTPVILCVKLFMKELWQLNLDWDDKMPSNLLQTWQNFERELPLLSEFIVPRHIGVVPSSKIKLIGFSDASEKAYAAVVYVVVEDYYGVREARLLCAKSKVAPMKTVSIPRLELCGALLLARLLKLSSKVYSRLVPVDEVRAFSDSTVVLYWIKSSPHRWKSFVANRVTQIQEIVPGKDWYHVKGDENPADAASRGLSPSVFLQNSSWLSGPSWLQQVQSDWPLQDLSVDDNESRERELRPAQCLITTTQNPPLEEEHPFLVLASRCSSWSKLLRIIVYVLRFVRTLNRGSSIQGSDLETAETVLLKVIQENYFKEELKNLRKGRMLPKFLKILSPFVHEGLLRVGGRLTYASLSFDHKHPILLPKKSHCTNLLIDYMHQKNLHAGPSLLCALMRQKFWIIGARDVIRSRVRLCNHCFKCKPKTLQPFMGSLPLPRITEAKPFLHTGVDFGGPFSLTLSRYRGVKKQKGYLCLFVCMATRAIHLECASDLSTDCFLAAFKRFLSRRGPCSVMYSDQGTNFVGAKNYLNSLYEFLDSQNFKNKLLGYCAESRIEWRLNPPSAPHFGGIWEAGIKSVKSHLIRVVGEQILTFEEFTTVLCQIEALLNSRPLCWLSTDPSEPIALTPAHFLTLMPLQSLPALELEEGSINRLQRWKLIDQLVKGYWKRWRSEYLSTLQARLKWNSSTCPVVPGTLVIISQENSSPLKWPLGRIEEVYPGKDGVVRVALVKTKVGFLKRPLTKLAPLPTQ